mmetsp:Transcript_14048/g.30672  ORF Transcript_14048/g.30672 Transcript_14048/m.30672 type:complete len:167 (+) Transcript_14048:75-575(+)
MVLFQQKLNDKVFCLQEEKDFFQARYLEQVSELQALRDELSKTKKEVVRLRQELMDRTPDVVKQRRTSGANEKEEDTASCLTDDEEVEEKAGAAVLYEEDAELRQSAEKLLQWASYRASSGRYSRTEGSEGHDSQHGEHSENEEDDEEEKSIQDDVSSLTSKPSDD